MGRPQRGAGGGVVWRLSLRKTVAALGVASGRGLPVIGALFGTKEARTTQRYAYLEDDPLRVASEAIGGQVAAALAGDDEGDVVHLKRGQTVG